jgi:uncharacterized protein (DUF1800 family)
MGAPQDIIVTPRNIPQQLKDKVGELPARTENDDLFRQFANETVPQRTHTVTSGLNPYTGPWTQKEMLHLLRRTTFGATVPQLNILKTKTMAQSVAMLLTHSGAVPPPVNDYNNSIADPDVAVGATWVNADPSPVADITSYRIFSMKSWLYQLMLKEGISITEKMTLFWHNLLATQAFTVFNSRFLYRYFNLLRTQCLGNYKQLVKGITIDPMMLYYLNGNQNSKQAPDENYGRELQELFTLGKGPGSQYTEGDVQAAARVLTGWKADWVTGAVSFNSNDHETANKQFSAFYGNRVITGRAGAAGAQETDDLIDMILQQPETAKYICRRLYRWFVYYAIDAQTETNVIEPLAEIFRTNNYNILPVLDTLLKSEHFFDMASVGCFIKTPADFVIGLSKNFNVNRPAYADVRQNFEANVVYIWLNESMNMNVTDPPNVAGWPAFRQEPLFYQVWINSDTYPKRSRYSDYLIFDGVYVNSNFRFSVNHIAFIQQFSNPENPNLVVQNMIDFLLSNDLSTAQKTAMKNILLSNQGADHYWSDAWNAYLADPLNTVKEEMVRVRLKSLIIYITRLAEYQLA